MKFEYILNGIGWADVEMEIDGEVYYSCPSYLSEPLIDLSEGILRIIPGCVPDDKLKLVSTFKWFGEPSIDKWSIRLLDNSRLNILIEHFESESSIECRREFEGTCNIKDFLMELTKALEKLLDKHGFVGYKDTWYGNEFPFSSYLKLKSYLISGNTVQTLEESDVSCNYGIKSNLNDEINLLLDNIKNL